MRKLILTAVASLIALGIVSTTSVLAMEKSIDAPVVSLDASKNSVIYINGRDVLEVLRKLDNGADIKTLSNAERGAIDIKMADLLKAKVKQDGLLMLLDKNTSKLLGYMQPNVAKVYCAWIYFEDYKLRDLTLDKSSRLEYAVKAVLNAKNDAPNSLVDGKKIEAGSYNFIYRHIPHDLTVK